jgi:AraC-like DNA-binding protein
MYPFKKSELLIGLPVADHAIEFNSLPIGAVQGLLDQFPRTPFFIKNARLEYVACNDAMIEFCGAANRCELIGKRAEDFFQKVSSRRTEALETQTMRTLRPAMNRLELTMRRNERAVWTVFSFWPLAEAGHLSAGIVAAGRVLDASIKHHATYEGIARAVDYLHHNYPNQVSLADVARSAGLPVRTLNSHFLNLFGLSPLRYLTKVRLEASAELLRSDIAIAEIAHACGYSDQSAFTRRFTAAVGMSPTQFRRTLRP